MQLFSSVVVLWALAADAVAPSSSQPRSSFLRAGSGKQRNITGGRTSAEDQAALSDDEILALAGTMPIEPTLNTHGLANVSAASRSGQNATRVPRNVFIDLGANWANTLRLYQDLVKSKAGQPWEVYAFEASPFIQPYLEKFTAFLNGQGPQPPLTVPPSGSSLHLNMFAPRYGCPTAEYAGWEPMRQCMFRIFKQPLSQLKPDPALKNPALISSKLATASTPLPPGATSRFVSVPAAAGAKDGTLNLGMMTAQQMIRGGAISRPVYGAPVQTVPMVNVVSWIVNNFDQADYVVVKMDIEGAEFPILSSLLSTGDICKLDLLAMECHGGMGNCPAITYRVKQNACVKLLTEGSGYQSWDHFSSPDKYFAADPRP